MSSTTTYFYEGLTCGLVLGITLNLIRSYIFKDKSKTCHIKCRDGCLQQKPNSPVKIDGEFKMALLVRHDLKMGKGKVAAQVRIYFIRITFIVKNSKVVLN